MHRHLLQPAQLHASPKTAADRRSRRSTRHSTLDTRLKRSAFTLVELLVAMGIFVILATLTVGALRTNNADRTGNSVGTIRNALEGARSRAISSGEPRGLRLLTDPNDGRIVTSLIYVGANGYHEGTLPATGANRLRYLGDFDANNNGSVTDMGDVDRDGDGVLDPPRWGFRQNNIDSAIFSRELLKAGNRIEMPAHSGRWYTISFVEESGSELHNDGQLDIIFNEHVQPSTWTGNGYTRVGGELDYRVELAPSILEGAEPILLSPGTCIDLDACVIPWRNGTSAYDDPMDIMFSPSGTITGDLATEGILHFRVAYVSDVVLASRPSGFGLPTDPEKDHRAVSVFTSTGNIIRAEIGITGNTADGYNNNISTNTGAYYQFAIEGKEGK